jgi:hypothetical protein
MKTYSVIDSYGGTIESNLSESVMLRMIAGLRDWPELFITLESALDQDYIFYAVEE